jgi:hypothetical protein
MDPGRAGVSTRRTLTRDPVDRESVEHHLGVHPVAEPLVRGRLEGGDRLGGDAEELLEVQVSSPSEERLALCIALPYRIRCPSRAEPASLAGVVASASRPRCTGPLVCWPRGRSAQSVPIGLEGELAAA